MLRQMAGSADADRYFEEASDLLHVDVLTLDTAEALTHNANVQICIYLREMICAGRLLERESCEMVSGHSVGSFAAAGTAGVFSFREGLALVAGRGQKMQELFPGGYGMMACSGLTASRASGLADSFFRESGIRVWPAVVNEPLQTVFSGAAADLKAFGLRVKEQFPAELTYLRVYVPSHCALMDPVSEYLKEQVNRMTLLTPSCWYLSNYEARRTKQIGRIADDFVYGVSHPVRWYDGITLMRECGVERFIEVGGRALTGIGRNCFPECSWMTMDLDKGI